MHIFDNKLIHLALPNLLFHICIIVWAGMNVFFGGGIRATDYGAKRKQV